MGSPYWFSRTPMLATIGLSTLMLSACSGSTEDVRVTFCKDIAAAMVPSGATITWDEPTIAISRPSHAITQLSFAIEDTAGAATAEAACWFKFQRGGHSPSAVANPILEYETLPYAMTFNNRELSAAELKKLVNAEQLRRAGALLDTLQKGATDVADQVRAGIGG